MGKQPAARALVAAVANETTHWHRNDGQDNVVLIAVDIFNAAK